MAAAVLTPMQRYAAGGLFALALREAQIHQTHPLGGNGDGDEVPDRYSSCSSGSGSTSASGDGDEEDASAQMWTHQSRGLLRPVFVFLEIDPKAWPGLEETAASSTSKHHVGAFLRMLFEESDGTSGERSDQELALTKAVDALAMSLEETSPSEETQEKCCKYEHECLEKVSVNAEISVEDEASKLSEAVQVINSKKVPRKDECLAQADDISGEKSTTADTAEKNQCIVAVLYQVLSSCLAVLPEDLKGHSRQRKGYDARHRVALRLLATWLNIKWIKMDVAFFCTNFSEDDQ